MEEIEDGQIICTNDGGLCYYNLYRDDDIKNDLLLCDGEIIEFDDWKDGGKYKDAE